MISHHRARVRARNNPTPENCKLAALTAIDAGTCSTHIWNWAYAARHWAIRAGVPEETARVYVNSTEWPNLEGLQEVLKAL